jgi:hypothetical protein
MSTESIPTLEEFLAAPVEEVAKVAPATMIYAPGGTRRQAVFQGIEPWSDDFISWARDNLFKSSELIFSYGVKHLILPFITPGNLQEVNRYREVLVERAQWVLSGFESQTDYRRLGWRVRLLGSESLPELRVATRYFIENTPAQSMHTLHWLAVVDTDSPWRDLLAAVQQSKSKTRAEAVLALYGEEIPPATLYLATGKPTISFDLIPPLLVGQIQCYWNQQPGYTLSEPQLRTIFYDYAYLRPTWYAAKLGRAKEALAHRQAWEEAPMLGLGMRLGPFWYPAPMSSPAWPTEQEHSSYG